MATLKRIEIKGYRSIRDAALELRQLNVLIGANGAGKSNLISFFRMLSEMMGGRLQKYIAETGRAQTVLHYGPKRTPQMEATLEFDADGRRVKYYQRLFHTAGDTLAFADEWIDDESRTSAPGRLLPLGTGHLEALVGNSIDPADRALRSLLNECRVYHFHDTSATSRARAYCYIGNDRWLMPDGGNIAAMLYRFRKDKENPAYRRVLGTVRQIAPFLADFDLQPTGPGNKDIILNWKDQHAGEVFGPHQLSDGTLRFICLVTLLLQPQSLLPSVVVIDEPELGLHPAGLNLLGGMLRSAAHHCQVIVATQSAALVDGFAPEDIVVVNRSEGASTFQRLGEDQLKEWLQDYSLGELWEKNVVGGGPFA